MNGNGFFFPGLPPLALYVHIPWCEKKCPYCDFNSHQSPRELAEDEYVDSVLADLDQELPNVWGRRLHSIFIGGGTPSLFDPESIERLLSGIRARLLGIPDLEVTLEANPGSAEAGKFQEFRDAGVNRISIGVQSFDDNMLRRIGRIHDADNACSAVQAVLRAGFENFNLDLMHSLPGQDLELAVRDIDIAISFNPAHISYYQLTIEPSTIFHKYPPRLPDNDLSWEMQAAGEQTLDHAGYRQYEISAYARESKTCRHNLNYWQFGDYLGIGAGAHSKITLADGITRSWKVKHPADYMAKANSDLRVGGRTFPSTAEVRFEFMLNALRLRQPVSALLFQQHTGQSVSCLKPALLQAQNDGLLEFDGKYIHTTSLGYRFLNDLLQRFLPETAEVELDEKGPSA